MSTFEITIQRQAKGDNSYPVVVEYTRTDSLLSPIRKEGELLLDEATEAELAGLALRRRAYGTMLGKALFADDIRDAFRDALTASQGEDDDHLRVLLVVEDEALRPLHWERLCGPIGTGANRWNFLALDQRILFAMYLPSLSDKRFRAIGRRDLRTLIVVANPMAGNRFDLAPFDAEATVKGVERSLGEIEYDVLGNVPEALGPATVDELSTRLMEPHYTVLHVVAHGWFRDDGETILYLVDGEGKVQPIAAGRLIERLDRLRGMPHFAFFSTCESADPRAERAGALGGMAQRLVRESGLPAVVAMTEKVTIPTANALADNFYARLREHGQVDRALVEAGVSLSDAGDILVAALYTRLGGRPLFSDTKERDLTAAEIEYGLSRFESFLPERAPVLEQAFTRQAAAWRAVLTENKDELSTEAKKEWESAEAEVNTMCEEVLDLNFRALALDQEPPRYDDRRPFPGLLAFQAADKDFFFGREAIVRDLGKRIEAHPFLAVLGASGSGKSSLVLAGLIPELNARMLYMTPGSDPVGNLSTILGSRQGEDIQGSAQALVVDQFEELFTHCQDIDQRRDFIDRLLDLIDGEGKGDSGDPPPLKVIVTMRADFWGECAPYPRLKAAMQRHQELLAPMTTPELRSAMEQQANQVGLRFEADLSHTILSEVEDEPGAMPLLQHLLQEMWRRRRGRWLRASEYHNLGGIKRAIALTADELYAELKAAGHAAQVREIFTRLTRVEKEPGPDGTYRDTRQRVTMADLIGRSGDASEIRKLVSRLAGARLLVTRLKSSSEQLDGEDGSEPGIDDSQVEVEVSHEALIRHWDRLRRWIDDSRDILVLEREIREDAVAWAEAKSERDKQDHLLYRGGRLEDIQNWLAEGRLRLGDQAIAYIEACAAFEKQRIEELQRLLDESERQAKIALTRELAALASSTKHDDELATLLAIEAYLLNQEIHAGVQWLIDRALRELISRPYYSIIKTIEGWGRSVEFSPDSRYVAVGNHEATWVWEWTNPAAEPLLLIVDEYEIYIVAFSPDGRHLASGNFLGVIRIWDLANLEGQPRELQGHTSVIRSLDFSPDGKYLLSGSHDNTARIWDLSRNPATSRELYGGESEVTSARFSPNGKMLAVASEDVMLWDLSELEARPRILGGHKDVVRALAFSPNGKILATGGNDQIIRLWNVDRLESDPRILDGHEISVLSLKFAADGKRLISSGADRIIQLWNMRDLSRQPKVLSGHTADVNAVTASPDGSLLASTSNDKTVRLWDVSEPNEPNVLRGSGDSLYSGTFNQTGRWLAAGSRDDIFLWDMESPTREPRKLSGHTGSVYCVRFSPDGRYLASAGDDHTVRLWRLEDPQVESLLIGRHEAAVQYVAFSPDGLRLASAGRDENICLWELAGSSSATEPVILKDHKLWVESVAFTPDGKQLASTGGDNIVRFWDLATGTVTKKLLGQRGWIHEVVFSQDGRYLATPAGDRTVWLRDMHDLDADALVFGGHHHEVNAVAISSDGANLATASRDGVVRLWDLTDPRAAARELTGHVGEVESVVFSPDDKVVASCSIDGTVRLWTVSLANLVEMGCQKVRRDLTRAEWEQYMPSNRPYQPTCAAVQELRHRS